MKLFSFLLFFERNFNTLSKKSLALIAISVHEALMNRQFLPFWETSWKNIGRVNDINVPHSAMQHVDAKTGGNGCVKNIPLWKLGFFSPFSFLARIVRELSFSYFGLAEILFRNCYLRGFLPPFSHSRIEAAIGRKKISTRIFFRFFKYLDPQIDWLRRWLVHLHHNRLIQGNNNVLATVVLGFFSIGNKMGFRIEKRRNSKFCPHDDISQNLEKDRRFVYA